MPFTLSSDGSVTYSPDFEFLAGAALNMAGLRSAPDRFRAIRKMIASNRTQFSLAARDYYKSLGFQSLGETSLLGSEATIFPRPIRLDASDKCLRFEDSDRIVNYEGASLPNKLHSYIENIVEYQYGSDWNAAPFHRKGVDLVYRLTSYNSDAENPVFTFSRCQYLDYINSCEYHAHSIVNNFVSTSSWRSDKEIAPSRVRKGAIKDPFSFDELNCSVGINTLLVLADPKDPVFFLHNRSRTKVAEAGGLKHVVPAGTFQPIHNEDTNHNQDFSIYANVVREFAEELLGDPDVTHPFGYREDIYERKSIRPIHHLLSIGRGGVFFNGFGVDALTAKPEFLTTLVLVKSDLERLFPDDFIRFSAANYEGSIFQDRFTTEQLKKWRDHPMMLAAGAGCLQQGISHFDYFSSFGSCHIPAGDRAVS